jgi:hypothetical protein
VSCCPICLGECHEENARIRALIVNYVKARRERETYAHNHTGENRYPDRSVRETMRGVDLAQAVDAVWAALVAEADRT